MIFKKANSICNDLYFKRVVQAFLCLLLFVACSSDKEPLFQLLENKNTKVDFVNRFLETEEVNLNEYLYAYNGGGVAVGDINNDGFPDMYFTANQSGNTLYLNKSKENEQISFEDITEKAGVKGFSGKNYWTTGVVMVDINHDGWLDIYVSQMSGYKDFTGRNLLFINNHNLTFSEKAKEYQLDLVGYCQQAAFFDYDNDGDLDLYQLNHSVHSPEVYLNTSLRNKRDPLAGDKLLRNDNGKFVDVSEKAGIWGWAAAYGLAVGVADLDNNGFADIYVSNDFHENDYVYFNQGDGTFLEKSKEATTYTSNFSMGSDIADINNDGLLDIMTLDMKPDDDIVRKQSAGADPFDIFQFKLSFGYQAQFPRNMLQLNQGNLDGKIGCRFSEIGQLAGVDATDWSWSTLLADLDNDGLKDIFVSNGIYRRPNDLDYINYTYQKNVKKSTSLKLSQMMPSGAEHNFAYRNQGNLQFEDVSQAWGFSTVGYSMGTAYADLDNDGDLDLVINNLNALASIYENKSNAEENHYLKIQLKGAGKNPFGIGAKVEIVAQKGTIVQELQPTRGWLSSMDYILNFGLGAIKTIQEIKVTWANGKVQVLKNRPVNQLLILSEKNAFPEKPLPEKAKQTLWQDITEQSNLKFVHQENSYLDFANERLMPQMLSTQGPKIAVADVNGDGLEDFFVGGAMNQAGVLYLQKNDKFVQGNQQAFMADKQYEDADIQFFDADNDTDLDLLILSAGGQTNEASLTPLRLYLNDGKGNFSRSSKEMPLLWSNKSCLVTADFDGDKRMDIFVGVRSIVKQYGISADSYVLMNRGNGEFTLDTSEKTAVFKNLGMVTSAVWLPKSKELVVAGDWMPITILKREANGTFSKRIIAHTAGWWNCLKACDLDNDGDLDILAGNRGINSDLRATTETPVTLMVKDFDNSFSTDPIICHFRNGKERLYEGLDEIKKQMPMIQNRFHEYKFFAVSQLKDIFPEALKKNAVIKQVETFESLQLINDGQSNFQTKVLPKHFQFAPIYAFCTKDFNQDRKIDLVSGGNFSGFKPNIGMMKASVGTYSEGNSKGDFNAIPAHQSGLIMSKEVRDIQAIRLGNRDCLLIANNSEHIQLFQFFKNQQ